MNDDVEAELVELRREAAELRRYRDLVKVQVVTGGKLAGLAAFLWLGPDLVRALHNWMKARAAGAPLPDVETAHVVAAVVRRVLRVGLVAVSLAVLPAILLVWQNTLMPEQLVEARKQNIELVRHQRKNDLKRSLAEAEDQIGRMLDLPFGSDLPLGRVMSQDPNFLAECQKDGTRAHKAVASLMTIVYPYARLLSELYLLDTRVLDPLSDSLSEEQIAVRGAATSADVYWLAQKIVDVVEVLESCRPDQTALFRLVRWNSRIEDNEYHRYIIPATDIKYKYDIAKTRINITENLQLSDVPEIKIVLENTATRPFDRVVVRCLVTKDGRDIASKLMDVGAVRVVGKTEAMISLSELANVDLEGAQTLCNIDSALSKNAAVTTLE